MRFLRYIYDDISLRYLNILELRLTLPQSTSVSDKKASWLIQVHPRLLNISKMCTSTRLKHRCGCPSPPILTFECPNRQDINRAQANGTRLDWAKYIELADSCKKCSTFEDKKDWSKCFDCLRNDEEAREKEKSKSIKKSMSLTNLVD